MRARHRILLVLALVLASCASTGRPSGVPKAYSRDEVPEALERASAEVSLDPQRAVWRMHAATRAAGLDAQSAGDVQRTLERAADAYVDTFEAPDANPRPLEKLLDLDLPRRIEVRAGMRAARLWFERGKRMRAFRLVQRVDREYPQHYERRAAGRLLFDIGESLANDKGRYGLFFRYSALAPQVLEYLVLEHPSDPNGDQALRILAETYERKRHWNLAIEKHQDLILWFADSPLLPWSRARIPHLRLASLDSPEYDRSELVRARRELEAWLGDFPGSAFEPEARADYVDCLRRLADNDLIVARFYRRVDNKEGAEYHARRALDEARAGADAEQIRDAEELLEAIVAMERPAEEPDGGAG